MEDQISEASEMYSLPVRLSADGKQREFRAREKGREEAKERDSASVCVVEMQWFERERETEARAYKRGSARLS